MKNLGRAFLALVLIPNAIYAGVTASVDYASVSVGDTVTYSIKVDGNDLQRPIIDRLCGGGVIATSAQTNIEMINGNYAKTKILSYQFMPQENCLIEPMDIVVDGKTQRTNAVKVEVKPATADVNPDFVVELSVAKKDIFKQNKENLLEAITLFETELTNLKQSIRNDEWEKVRQEMEDGNKLHDILD